ncbi:RNA polymerase sigma factor [Stenotrophomonas mori]|uniref:RNA polymerase sigma factor n=1 Tax=Stenotrophomonas mori TaxID=2871096 RepID=A0ABT0SDT9_9GAMM|nr:RNA polymerase sigma factor [Stenotrophomonas mori]MCL7713248.1 RNA polymerase sigma factor [Stenotrophomonas mori]
MDAHSQSIAAWVTREILPHEPMVRGWLVRHWGGSVDIDDVIQEAYCRLSELASVDHIQNGRAYFFTTVRAVAIDMVRGTRTANIRPLTENDWLNVMDDAPPPDRAAEAGQTLLRVEATLSRLSLTCRQVIELRRVHGLSQAETARRLGVTENVVENHIVRGLRSLLKAIEQDPQTAQEGTPAWTPSTGKIAEMDRPLDGRRGRRTGR